MKNFNKKQIKKWRLIKLFFYTLYFFTVFSVVIIFRVNWLATFLLIISGVMAIIAELASEKETNFKKGESGELVVENILKSIPNIYAYRDVIIESDAVWNIDFVVVSLSGIFIIEVKTYEGRIIANNDNWYQFIKAKRRVIGSFSKQAKSNAFKFREYIISKNHSYPYPYFTPVVVLTNPFDKNDIKNSNVAVTSPDEIQKIIAEGSKLSIQQVELLVAELDKLVVRL